MAKKIINLDEIDESFIIASVKKDKSAIPENPERLLQPSTPKAEEHAKQSEEQHKEENRRKRKTQDYEDLFVRESDITARLGKTVYIRKEFHERIQKIVQVVGENEVSLFSYIDNVLSRHFEDYQDDISKAYRRHISNDVF